MHRYTLFLQSCSCTDTYLNICIKRYADIHKYANMHTYTQMHICIYAYAYMHVCLLMQYADMQYALYTFGPCSCSETNHWSYLLPLGKSSPAQGICKTAFLKHPRRFWLQNGHGARLTQVFLPFQDSFFGPKCVRLLRVLPSYLSSCIGFLGAGGGKNWGDWVRSWQLRQSSAFYDSWDCINCVFIVPTFKSLNFLSLWKQIRMSTKEKESPLIRHAEANVLAFKFNSLVSLVNTYWVVDLWEKMWLFKAPTFSCQSINE